MATPPPYHTWRRWAPFLTVILVAILFDRLFWDHDLALNLFLFTVLVVSMLVQRYGWRGLSMPARATLFGSVIAASMVVVHHSIVACVGAIVSMTVFTALAHERQLRSVIYAVPQAVVNFFMVPLAAWEGAGDLALGHHTTRTGWRWTDPLLRKRVRRPHWLAPRAMNPLERERRMGMVLLVVVNALLLVVNVIDISWVWFDFEVPENFSLKQFVHEGTWMLIISILLSILILLHLFRGNLNFYRRTHALKLLASLWIGQNFILGISVFLRNYHYIGFHGLAYKRIGVIVFLALVLVGLVTLY